MAPAENTVAVEKSVHDALRKLAQEAWDMHGICVQSVLFSWIDCSTLENQKLILNEVKAETLTQARMRSNAIEDDGVSRAGSRDY